MNPFYSSSFVFTPFWFGIGAIGLLLFLVVLVLKGYALWHAARRSETWWFIALLILNTAGILELVYLYFIVGKWHNFTDGNKPSTPPTTPASN
jgi:hypothetical protein